jgi:hypothetical protein
MRDSPSLCCTAVAVLGYYEVHVLPDRKTDLRIFRIHVNISASPSLKPGLRDWLRIMLDLDFTRKKPQSLYDPHIGSWGEGARSTVSLTSSLMIYARCPFREANTTILDERQFCRNEKRLIVD